MAAGAEGVGVGFLSWIKGRRIGGTETRVETLDTSTDLGSGADSVVHDGVEVGDPKERQAIIDEVDRLAHQFLDSGAAAAGSGGGPTVTSSTTIIVDGRQVSPDDPRAREKMAEAISKLRAQGFDDLADQIARQLGAAPQAVSSDARSAAGEAPGVPADGADDAPAEAEPAGDGPSQEPGGPIPPAPPAPPAPPTAPPPPSWSA